MSAAKIFISEVENEVTYHNSEGAQFTWPLTTYVATFTDDKQKCLPVGHGETRPEAVADLWRDYERKRWDK